MYEGGSKSCKPHPERRAKYKLFLTLLIKVEKLIQISVLISMQVRPIKNERCLNIFKWTKLKP